MEQHMMEFHKKVVKKKDCSNEKKPIIVYKVLSKLCAYTEACI